MVSWWVVTPERGLTWSNVQAAGVCSHYFAALLFFVEGCLRTLDTLRLALQGSFHHSSLQRGLLCTVVQLYSCTVVHHKTKNGLASISCPFLLKPASSQWMDLIFGWALSQSLCHRFLMDWSNSRNLSSFETTSHHCAFWCCNSLLVDLVRGLECIYKISHGPELAQHWLLPYRWQKCRFWVIFSFWFSRFLPWQIWSFPQMIISCWRIFRDIFSHW